jgi:hypothetical protein
LLHAYPNLLPKGVREVVLVVVTVLPDFLPRPFGERAGVRGTEVKKNNELN